MTWKQLTTEVGTFDERLRNALKELKIETATKALTIDHACVRMSTPEATEKLLGEITAVGQIISSEQINGRLIHIIELQTPLQLLGRSVRGLEIPHPKANQSYPEGWEHIEFVLPSVTANTPEGIEQAFFNLFPRLSKTLLKQQFAYKISVPEAESDQLPNPTINLKVHDVGLKFHALPIQNVVGFIA